MTERQLRIDANVTGNAAASLNKVNAELANTERQGASSTRAINLLNGAMAAFGVAVTANAAINLAANLKEQGEAWASARAAVEAYTGSQESAVIAIKEAQDATEGLVSKTQAATAVNVFLRNGLADNASEAGRLALAGQTLSAAYEAQGASLEKFVRYLSTGNIALADNFNITQSQINALSKQIEATEGLTGAEADAEARKRILIDAANSLNETMPIATRAQQEFNAEMADLAAVIGEQLLPAYAQLLNAVTQGVRSSNDAMSAERSVQEQLIASTNSYEEYVEAAIAYRGEHGRGASTLDILTNAQRTQMLATIAASEQIAIQSAGMLNLGEAIATANISVETMYGKIGTLNNELLLGDTSVESWLAKVAMMPAFSGEAELGANALRIAQDALNEALERGIITQEQYVDATKKLVEGWTPVIGAHEKYLQDIRDTQEKRLQELNDITARYNERQADNYDSHLRRVTDMDLRAGDMAIDHAQRIADLRQQIEAAANAGIESRRRQLSRSLEDLADRHTDKIRSIREQIAGLEQSYEDTSRDRAQEHQDKITDLTESHEERRERLVRELARAKTSAQRREIEQRIADEDAAYERQKAKLERDYAQEIERAERKHQQQLEALQRRIRDEEKEYKDQQKELKKRAREDIAATQAANAQRVAELQARIAQEEASYARQQRDLQLARDRENEAVARASAKDQAQYLKSIGKLEGVSSATTTVGNTTTVVSAASITAVQKVVDKYKDLEKQVQRVNKAIKDAPMYTYAATNVPYYQTGTSYVPQTGLAMLHKGEKVIPAGGNGRSGGEAAIVINLTYSPVVSLADQYEAKTKLIPFILEGLRQAGVSVG